MQHRDQQTLPVLDYPEAHRMARREQAKAVRQMFADLRSWLSEQKARRQDGAGRVGRVTGRVTGNLTGRGPVASRG